MTLTDLMKQLQDCESMIKGKSIEANKTKVGTFQNPAMGNGRRSRERQVMLIIFPLLVERSRRRKIRTRRKLSVLLVGKWDISRRILRST